jgi:hypothetical protein
MLRHCRCPLSCARWFPSPSLSPIPCSYHNHKEACAPAHTPSFTLRSALPLCSAKNHEPILTLSPPYTLSLLQA